MLWAGSVEMRSTLSLTRDSSTARLQLEEEEGGGGGGGTGCASGSLHAHHTAL